MTIHDEQPDAEHPESLLRQGREDREEPLEMDVPGETSDPAADDGQMDSQDMPTTDGEMVDPEGSEGWSEFQKRGALE